MADPYFSDFSYGFRPHRRAQQAVIKLFERELLGERPCSAVKNNDELEELLNCCSRADTEVTGAEVVREPLSTDCNIPLSLGIPATCIGLCRGGKAHTRDEWVEVASLVPGLKVGLNIINDLCF